MIIAQRQLDELCLYKVMFNIDVQKGEVLKFLFYVRNYTRLP